jgi:sugar phosphate isomerase/epimerase
MITRTVDRREFIKDTLSLSALALVLHPLSGWKAMGATASAGKMRLGAPVFEKIEDPEGLALAHRKLGYRAAYCPDVQLKDSSRIAALSAAFEKHDVVIAEVGRWCNLLDADETRRRQNLQTVTDGLALADAIGARCCVDIAGSYNATSWFGPHPENLSDRFFDATVENARKIIDAVKPKRSKLAFEMMGWALPDSADANLRLIKAVDRPGFAVHLDPCNLVNCPDKFYHNTALLNECFDKLGAHIVSCHAKDLAWEIEMNVHFKEVLPGTGSLDYSTFLKRIAMLPQCPPLMIEHLANAGDYLRARDFIQETARKNNLSFE